MTKTIIHSTFTVQAMEIMAAQFYHHLLAVLKQRDFAFEDRIIIGVELNCPINPVLDKPCGIIWSRKKIVDHIEEIQVTFNLHDIWRLKPQRKKFYLVSKI